MRPPVVMRHTTPTKNLLAIIMTWRPLPPTYSIMAAATLTFSTGLVLHAALFAWLRHR
jgi:hypothetical protein